MAREKNYRFVPAGFLTLLVVVAVLFQTNAFGLVIDPEDPPPEPGSEGSGPPPAVPGKYGATIYQGVVAVTTGEAGASMLEIGNSGQEIASTGSMYLRPSSMAAASSIRFEKVAAGLTRLHVPGGVCFGSSSCQDVWPSGSGTSYWDLISNHYLQPKAGYKDIAFATSTGYHSALEVNANSSDTAFAATSIPSTGSAAAFDNGIDSSNDISVDARPATGDEVMIVDRNTGTRYKVWHSANDGHTDSGVGLDASKLDGVDLSFRVVPQAQFFYASCGNPGGPVSPDQNCFCGDFASVLGGYVAIRCIRLQ